MEFEDITQGSAVQPQPLMTSTQASTLQPSPATTTAPQSAMQQKGSDSSVTNANFTFVKPANKHTVKQNITDCVNNVSSVSGIPVCQDMTSVKTLYTDATNPNLVPENKVPTRGRSRVANRSVTRAERRSSSATPYRRQSSASKSKGKSDQLVLPSDKNNSPVIPVAKISTGNAKRTVSADTNTHEQQIHVQCDQGQPPSVDNCDSDRGASC